jgi:signal transduction histidine kinase
VEQSNVAPLLTELERISGRVDTERAAADQALIADLRSEIAELRAAVAHLRAGSAALPARLRPAVARAMTSAGSAVVEHKS